MLSPLKMKHLQRCLLTENENSTIMTANELGDHGWKQNHDMMQKHSMENHSHSESADTEHRDMHQ